MKKKEERKKASSTPVHQPQPPPTKEIHTYATSKIIELRLKLGMTFNGPLSDLHTMIMKILAKQEEDWITNL